MKLSVRPGKREGLPKLLFDRELAQADLHQTPEGDVVLTFVASDIYTTKASQRFAITLSRGEIDMICAIGDARRPD